MRIHNYSSDYAYQLSKSLKDREVKESVKPIQQEDVVYTLPSGGEGEVEPIAETEDCHRAAEVSVEQRTDPGHEKTEEKKKKNKKTSD